jgi:hypothetical protein
LYDYYHDGSGDYYHDGSGDYYHDGYYYDGYIDHSGSRVLRP